MTNIKVIGMGALNIDHLYRVERILEDGETVVNEAIATPGGSAANTIHGLARLGVSAGFAGVVGDDAEGKMLLEDFNRVGVDTSRIKVKPGAKTGSVLCLSDRRGRRSLYVTPGANSLLTMDDLDLTGINRAEMLHLSSFADERQFKVSRELLGRLDSSVKVSFSPGALYVSKGLKALRPILARTHVLFINRSEIQQLTGEDFNTGAETCLNQGCRIVVVTLGKGASYKTIMATSYIRDANNEYAIESPPEYSKDTTGAGDAFATGFLYGMLKGKGLEDCGRLGDIVAQFSIKKVGAREGLPALTELSRRYQELYQQEL